MLLQNVTTTSVLLLLGPQCFLLVLSPAHSQFILIFPSTITLNLLLLSSSPYLNLIPVLLSRPCLLIFFFKLRYVLSIKFQCFCLQTGHLFTWSSVFYSYLRELKCSFSSVSHLHVTLTPFSLLF